MSVSKASLRGLRFSVRMEKMREAAQQQQKTVQVTPTNDDYRRVLKHPRAGGFPKSGSAAWPLDRFTERSQEALQDARLRLKDAGCAGFSDDLAELALGALTGRDRARTAAVGDPTL